MIDLELVHSVTIARRAETITSQELVFDANDTIASNVPCFLQPLAGAMIVGPMGIGQSEHYDATFLAGVDLEENDLLAWTDPATAQALTLVVRDVERVRDNLMGAGLESHVNAVLHLRKVTGA